MAARAVGIARYVVTGAAEAELAVEVVDAWQRHGVGRRLLEELRRAAAERGVGILHGTVVPGNDAILGLLGRTFPGLRVRPDGDVIEVVCPTREEAWTVDDVLGVLAGR